MSLSICTSHETRCSESRNFLKAWIKFCPSFQHFLTIWIKFASGDCLNSTELWFSWKSAKWKPFFTYGIFWVRIRSFPFWAKICSYLHMIYVFFYLSFSFNTEGLIFLVAVNKNCCNACVQKPYEGKERLAKMRVLRRWIYHLQFCPVEVNAVISNGRREKSAFLHSPTNWL